MEGADQKKGGKSKKKEKKSFSHFMFITFDFENSQESRQAIRNALLKWK